MGTFVEKVREIVGSAAARGKLPPADAEGLMVYAADADRLDRYGTATGVFAWLGGLVTVVGVALIIQANWHDIPDPVKLVGLLVLLTATHGVGFVVRWKRPEYRWTAGAFHFVGAGLVLAGIGLVAQIYNISGKPAKPYLVWLICIAPLAGLLRSGPITLMSAVALFIWVNVEGATAGSPLAMHDGLAGYVALNLALALALASFSSALRRTEPHIARAMRISSIIAVGLMVYVLGFYRRWSGHGEVAPGKEIEPASWYILPFAAAVLWAVGYALGTPVAIRRRGWMGWCAGAALLLAFLAAFGGLCASMGLVPRGERMPYESFGWTEYFDVADWVITVTAWVAWFALSMVCIAYGTVTGKRIYLYLGAIGVGLGALTRAWDLVGSLTTTGLIYIAGGIGLLLIGCAVDRRRGTLLTT